MNKLKLVILKERFVVARLDSRDSIPDWALNDKFYSITKTSDELSVVCLTESVPKNITAERDYRALKVQGPLDFSLTGILSSLANPLAAAKISIFAVSTYDTDYLFVKEENLNRTKDILGQFCTIKEEN